MSSTADPGPEFDLLVQESPPPYPPPPSSVLPGEPPFSTDEQPFPTDEPTVAPGEEQPPTRGGHAEAPLDDEAATYLGEYTIEPGIPGRGIAVTTMAATATVAAADVALTGGIGFFFDLCFVTICLVAAMAVQRHDLFTVGVLPPLVLAVLVVAVAVVHPAALELRGGVSTLVLGGLAAHASALVFGYGTALVTVGLRAVGRRHG